MKNFVRNNKRAFAFSLLSVVALAPVAIVVACGEDEEKIDTTQNYRGLLETKLNQITYFGAKAKSSNTEPLAIDLDPIAKEYKYLSGNYTTLEAAKHAAEQEWKSALPTEVGFEKEPRNLWIRVAPKTLAELNGVTIIKEQDIQSLSGDNQYFNITYASKIRSIKSDVAQSREYENLSLEGVKIVGTLDNASVEMASVVLPEGTQVEIVINNRPIKIKDIPQYLKENKGNLNAASIANATVQLGVTDKDNFVLESSKKAAITSSIPFIASVKSLVDALGQVVAGAGSDNLEITWSGLSGISVSRPSTVAKIEYYIGPIASDENLYDNKTVTWTETIPTKVSAEHETRNMWVKLTPALGEVLSQNLVNITSSSQIRKVKTLISPAAGNLGTMTLGGSLGELVINNLVVPQGNFKIEFKIKRDWLDRLTFIEWVKNHAPEITAKDLKAVKARYAVSNDELYKIGASFETALTNTIKFDYEPSTTLVNGLNAIRAASSSNSSRVSWEKVAELVSALPEEISGVKYYYGVLGTVNAVALAKDISWDDTLPTSVSVVHNDRHLFIKLIPSAAYSVASPIIDLTQSSKIREIKALISPSKTDLSVMALGGSIEAIEIKNLVVAPDNAKIQFRFNNSWIDSDSLALRIRENAAQITSQTWNEIKARYATIDDSLYVLSDNYEAAISTNIKLSYQPSAQLITVLNNLRAAATSNSESVTWEKIAELIAAKPTEISTITYYYGPLSTVESVSAAANITWSSDLPRTVSGVHNERHLFVKLTPTAQYAIANPIIDLTSSSRIQEIKTLISTAGVALNTITYKGLGVPAEIDTKNVTIPDHTVLKYKFNNNDRWLEAADFITYVSGLGIDVPLSEYQNVKVRIESDDTKYVVDNMRETSVALSGRNYRYELADRASKILYFTTSSISADVKAAPIVVDPIAKSYQYLSGDYSTLASAKSAPASQWKAILPTNVAFDSGARNLWLRVTPRTLEELGNQTAITADDIRTFNGDYAFINLTDASNIRKIKSDVEQQDAYAKYSLDGVEITGSIARATINYNGVSTLPGTELRFLVGTQALNEVSFGEYLRNNESTISRGVLTNIKIKTFVSDAEKFVLKTPKEALVSVLKILPRIQTVAEWEKIYPQFAGKINNEEVNDRAFYNMTLPVGFELPQLLRGIRGEAFWLATLPAGFSIPTRVTNIGTYAFRGAKLSSDFAVPSTTISYGSSPFIQVQFTADFKIPSAMTTIPNNLFSLAEFGAGFSIPSTVRKIGVQSFRGTAFAEGFTLPNSITEISSEAFQGSRLPASFRLPNQLTRIENRAFESTKLSAGFVIPATVTSIGENAFLNTTLPDGFIVPNTVITIASSAFTGARYSNGASYTIARG